MKINIGCSGYYYKSWVNLFYPQEVKQKEWLQYYATFFNTVELNNTFYHMPGASSVKGWYERSPDNFRFTVKGNREITHRKKLKNVRELLNIFYEQSFGLKEKLAAFLWQLPGNLHVNPEKIDEFCGMLDKTYTNVIEFRHNSWFTNEVFRILQKHGVTLCLISAPSDLKEMYVKTSGNIYVRFHGKSDWYNYLYSHDELDFWRKKIIELNPSEVFMYFNNDFNANAVTNGKQMKEMFEMQFT